MQEIVLKGRTVVEGYCRAEALVSSRPLSFLGGITPLDGKIVQKDHDLRGKCVKGKVLCFPHGHGSTVGSYVLYSMAKRNVAPKAIINIIADPVVVVGAIIADLPMIDRIDIKQIETGDTLEVDASIGIVRVFRKKES